MKGNMKTEEKLNSKDKQLVYISASIASGCRPCTKFHLKRSAEMGLTDGELNVAISLVLRIRNDATKSMETLITNQKISTSNKKEIEEDNNRNNVLVGVAATYSINFSSGLEKYLSMSRDYGISNDELTEIIKISKSVIDMARAHVDMITDKEGLDLQKENKNEEGCCSSSCDC